MPTYRRTVRRYKVARRYFSLSAPAAGTQYQSELAGTAGALTGSIVKETQKALAGIVGAINAVLSKLISKSLVGTSGNLIGDLNKLTSRGFSGAAGAISGVLTTAPTWGKTLAGEVGQITGSLIKSTLKSLTGSSGNITGIITKQVNKALTGIAGTLSATLDAIIIGLTLKTVGGTLGDLTGTINKQTNKALTGVSDGLTGLINKLTSKSFLGWGYENLIMSLTPVAYWRMDDASASTLLDKIGTHNGTENGTVVNEAAILPIGEGASGDFTTGDYDVANEVDFGLTSFSISAWIYLDTTPTDGTIFQRRNTSNVGGFAFEVNEDILRLWIYNGTWVAAGYQITSGTLYFVTGTYDNSSIKLYVNGSLVNTNTHANINTSISSPIANIGKNISNFAYRWNGNIQELAFFDSVLTSDEVMDIYKAGLGTRQLGGILTKRTLKSLAGISGALTGVLTTAMVFGKALSGVIGLIDGIITKKTNKQLSGTPESIIGSINKITNRTLSGITGNLSGVVTKLRSKILSGTVGNLTGAFSKILTHGRTLTGSISPSGILTKNKQLILKRIKGGFDIVKNMKGGHRNI